MPEGWEEIRALLALSRVKGGLATNGYGVCWSILAWFRRF